MFFCIFDYTSQILFDKSKRFGTYASAFFSAFIKKHLATIQKPEWILLRLFANQFMFHVPPSPTAMTQMSLHNHPLVPQPHSGNSNGPPPIPPRTYSNKSLMNGRPQHMVAPIKPMRKYCLEEFKFTKLLGKGSFGKVRKIL